MSNTTQTTRTEWSTATNSNQLQQSNCIYNRKFFMMNPFSNECTSPRGYRCLSFSILSLFEIISDLTVFVFFMIYNFISYTFKQWIGRLRLHMLWKYHTTRTSLIAANLKHQEIVGHLNRLKGLSNLVIRNLNFGSILLLLSMVFTW